MKIYIYIIILIGIYVYIIRNNIYEVGNKQHIFFWLTIASILLLSYLFTYHKYHLYKFFYNLKEIDKKPYFYK
jgi:hypothetical protein